jgi:hypothetical protein
MTVLNFEDLTGQSRPWSSARTRETPRSHQGGQAAIPPRTCDRK